MDPNWDDDEIVKIAAVRPAPSSRATRGCCGAESSGATSCARPSEAQLDEVIRRCGSGLLAPSRAAAVQRRARGRLARGGARPAAEMVREATAVQRCPGCGRACTGGRIPAHARLDRAIGDGAPRRARVFPCIANEIEGVPGLSACCASRPASRNAPQSAREDHALALSADGRCALNDRVGRQVRRRQAPHAPAVTALRRDGFRRFQPHPRRAQRGTVWGWKATVTGSAICARDPSRSAQVKGRPACATWRPKLLLRGPQGRRHRVDRGENLSGSLGDGGAAKKGRAPVSESTTAAVVVGTSMPWRSGRWNGGHGAQHLRSGWRRHETIDVPVRA
jgi:hypothetical protein